MARSIWPDEIMTPVHVHGVHDAGEYRVKQREYITFAKQKMPALKWRDPWVADEHPQVFILAGKWLVWCECGNYPSVHPEWRIACCFECGAIFQDLEIPSNASEIEAVLVKRPRAANRGWLPPQTVADLEQENKDNGLDGPNS